MLPYIIDITQVILRVGETEGAMTQFGTSSSVRYAIDDVASSGDFHCQKQQYLEEASVALYWTYIVDLGMGAY